MGRKRRFPDDRPVLARTDRYVVIYEDGRPIAAVTLNDLERNTPAAERAYGMPGSWASDAFIAPARLAFADYCARHSL